MPFELFRTVVQRIDAAITGRGRIDEALFDEMEGLMISGDISVRTAEKLLSGVRLAVRDERIVGSADVVRRMKQETAAILAASAERYRTGLAVSPVPPTVYLVVGVNGVGKTTTIAKLAHRLQSRGARVVLAAGDTFRAAAIDQLELWARRTGSDLVKHREGSDPSAVVFDALKAGRARSADFVIADTAGRLHTRANLMEELKKIERVTNRELGRPADEILLVLDATTGQNAISQARLFMEAIPITGIALAKLDGTARGGIVVSLVEELGLPIKLIGTGERAGDLADFDAPTFVEELFAGI
ncbi:MAG: signal recognition particle-docking protein FtsY [Armatimonadetes bacterium]|nr:signal recognition particle-docking protein FtsY [Armatimonadota bacterium]MDE2207116.1 signal recognition particle-docking protein FtsY [Armatimonadota bacterium]